MTEVGICWRAASLAVQVRKFSRWQGRSGVPSGTGSTRRQPRAEAALIAVSTPAAPGEVGVFAGSGLFWRGTGVGVAIVTIDGCGRRVGWW